MPAHGAFLRIQHDSVGISCMLLREIKSDVCFQCNAREIIAHECCQRWVHRKLYGNLQAKSFPTILPKWAKFCISAILVAPIKFWMLVRPRNSPKQDHFISPTVALLDVGKFPQKQRAISTYRWVTLFKTSFLHRGLEVNLIFCYAELGIFGSNKKYLQRDFFKK